MLIPRIITAVIMAVLLVLLLFYVDLLVFKIAIILITLLTAWEWANLSGVGNMLGRCVYAVLSVYVLLQLVAMSHHGSLEDLGFLNAFVPKQILKFELSLLDIFNFSGIIWAFIFLWVISYPASSVFWKSSIVRLILGWCVLLPFFIALVALHALPHGVEVILYLLLLIAAADVGAYIAGKNFGKRKLLIQVSPGKTWEGFFGGLVLAFFVALVALYFGYHLGLSSTSFIVVSLIISVVSVLGDLFESMLKRYRGIKDSSNLLPGHGGILDRVDSHLAAIPIFYLFYLLLKV